MCFFLNKYVQGQSTYSRQIKQVEDDIQQLLKKINELTGKCETRLRVETGYTQREKCPVSRRVVVKRALGSCRH